MPFAIAAVLTGLVLWTTPAMAHDAQRAAGKSIVTAEKDLPTGPRICLFSQNGKRAEPSPDSSEQIEPPHDAQPTGDKAKREAAAPANVEVANDESRKGAKAEAAAPTRQVGERVCDTDVTTPAAPHG